MTLYTIRPILTGWQFLDKGMYLTYGRGIGQIVEVPVFAFLLEGDGRRILVDTGMSDTEHSVAHHHPGRQEPGQAIHVQLARMGLSPDQIDIVVFTHLHWDHCYYTREFSSARLVVNEAEYRFANDPIPPYWKSYNHPRSGLVPPFLGVKFDLIHGEEQIAEGVSVFPTPGHSPGHQAVSVCTSGGTYVAAGDLFFCRENLQPDTERGWPLTPAGRYCSIVDLWRSMEDTIERADYILMTHDPSQIGILSYP